MIIDGWNIIPINNFNQLYKISKKWDAQWPLAGWTNEVSDKNKFWNKYQHNKKDNNYKSFNGKIYVVENDKNNGEGAFLLKCKNGNVEAETALNGYKGSWAIKNIISPKVIEWVKSNSSTVTEEYFPY